jgi:hypothetical protein
MSELAKGMSHAPRGVNCTRSDSGGEQSSQMVGHKT